MKPTKPEPLLLPKAIKEARKRLREWPEWMKTGNVSAKCSHCGRPKVCECAK